MLIHRNLPRFIIVFDLNYASFLESSWEDWLRIFKTYLKNSDKLNKIQLFVFNLKNPEIIFFSYTNIEKWRVIHLTESRWPKLVNMTKKLTTTNLFMINVFLCEPPIMGSHLFDHHLLSVFLLLKQCFRHCEVSVKFQY